MSLQLLKCCNIFKKKKKAHYNSILITLKLKKGTEEKRCEKHV